MTFVSQFPTVVKIGTAHAGFGKMKIRDAEDFEDFRSVAALQANYVVAEPFVDVCNLIVLVFIISCIVGLRFQNSKNWRSRKGV